MAPEVTMTTTLVHAPAPPLYKRKAPVINAASSAGRAPKKSPDTLSSTERVSNITPGVNCQGFSITAMPMVPRTMPVMAS